MNRRVLSLPEFCPGKVGNERASLSKVSRLSAGLSRGQRARRAVRLESAVWRLGNPARPEIDKTSFATSRKSGDGAAVRRDDSRVSEDSHTSQSQHTDHSAERRVLVRCWFALASW